MHRYRTWFVACFLVISGCGDGGSTPDSGGTRNPTSAGGASSGGAGGSGASGGAGGAGASGGSGANGGSGGNSGGAGGTTGGTAGGGGSAGSGGGAGSGASGGSGGTGGAGGTAGTTGGSGGTSGSAGGSGKDAGTTIDAGTSSDAAREVGNDAIARDVTAVDVSADANGDDGPPNRKPCTTSFGSGLTQAFGRLDGYLSAVIIPNQATCKPDNDHVYLQISMSNATYQIAVNVFSNQGDGGVPSQVLYLEKALTTLPDGAWQEGWHTGSSITFDYANNAGVHAADFTATPLQTLAQTIADRLVNVNHISIFATGYGADGADLVHRNGSSHDGAIVTEPLSATPHALMFHFSNQSF